MAYPILSLLLGLVFLGSILGGMSTETTLGGEETSVLQAVVSFDVFDVNWSFPFVHINPEWWSALGTMLLFDYAMFEGTWSQYVRWLFVFMGGGVAVTLLMWFIGVVAGRSR